MHSRKLCIVIRILPRSSIYAFFLHVVRWERSVIYSSQQKINDWVHFLLENIEFGTRSNTAYSQSNISFFFLNLTRQRSVFSCIFVFWVYNSLQSFRYTLFCVHLIHLPHSHIRGTFFEQKLLAYDQSRDNLAHRVNRPIENSCRWLDNLLFLAPFLKLRAMSVHSRCKMTMANTSPDNNILVSSQLYVSHHNLIFLSF